MLFLITFLVTYVLASPSLIPLSRTSVLPGALFGGHGVLDGVLYVPSHPRAGDDAFEWITQANSQTEKCRRALSIATHGDCTQFVRPDALETALSATWSARPGEVMCVTRALPLELQLINGQPQPRYPAATQDDATPMRLPLSHSLVIPVGVTLVFPDITGYGPIVIVPDQSFTASSPMPTLITLTPQHSGHLFPLGITVIDGAVLSGEGRAISGVSVGPLSVPLYITRSTFASFSGRAVEWKGRVSVSREFVSLLVSQVAIIDSAGISAAVPHEARTMACFSEVSIWRPRAPSPSVLLRQPLFTSLTCPGTPPIDVGLARHVLAAVSIAVSGGPGFHIVNAALSVDSERSIILPSTSCDLKNWLSASPGKLYTEPHCPSVLPLSAAITVNASRVLPAGRQLAMLSLFRPAQDLVAGYVLQCSDLVVPPDPSPPSSPLFFFSHGGSSSAIFTSMLALPPSPGTYWDVSPQKRMPEPGVSLPCKTLVIGDCSPSSWQLRILNFSESTHTWFSSLFKIPILSIQRAFALIFIISCVILEILYWKFPTASRESGEADVAL